MTHARSAPAPATRRRARWLVVAASGPLLAGCFTGERPSFEDEDVLPTEPTGNDDIDTVLGLLDSVNSAEFTAGYDIETKFGGVSSTGLVVQAAGQRRSVTVDNDARSVRFIIDGPDERTCDLTTAECEASLNDARISDTSLPHDFYGVSYAQRLRIDANNRIGDPMAYEKSIAGQAAQCVDINVGPGVVTYCALESGPLAEYEGADLTIELTSYSPEPDTTKFTSG